MTPTKEQINEAVFHSARLGEGSMPPLYEALRVLGIAYRAKCAEVEELRKALEPFAEPGHWNVNRNFWVCPDDPIRLARKALEGKE